MSHGCGDGIVPGVAGCCDPVGYRKVFNSRQARRAVRNFERHGLDSTAAAMIATLRERGLKVDIEAKTHDIPGLVEAVKKLAGK